MTFAETGVSKLALFSKFRELMSKNDKDLIKEKLRESYNEPADEFLKDAAKAEEFKEIVNAKLPPHLRMTTKECNSKSLSMRKKGEAKGGFPKLRGGHGPGRKL